MGIGGISIWQLLIVLAIVIMIFGTKKLKSLGADLGSAVKGFRQSVTDKSDTTSCGHDPTKQTLCLSTSSQTLCSTPTFTRYGTRSQKHIYTHINFLGW